MRNPVICETSPCFSLSLVRDSFRGTFAKWPDACLEYIFVFAKTKWELSKTFFTLAVAVGVHVGVALLGPTPPLAHHLAPRSLRCICYVKLFANQQPA